MHEVQYSENDNTLFCTARLTIIITIIDTVKRAQYHVKRSSPPHVIKCVLCFSVRGCSAKQILHPASLLE